MNKPITLIAASLVLAGCFPSKDDPTPIDGFTPKFLAAAASPDYATSDVAVVGKDVDGNYQVIEQQIHTTNPSDIRIAVFGEEAYRLGRYGFDNITKYQWDSEAETLDIDWQYSVLGDDTSANPYDMLIVSGTQAYVTRFDAQDLWQVNPTAASAAEFKTAEIDLSAYDNNAEGVTHMSDMELVGDHLFVLLTRLEPNEVVISEYSYTSLVANAASQVVVIDINTNAIVDTDTETAGVQAITLPVNNAGDFERVGNTLYIVGKGDQSGGETYKYTGGIVKLNPTTFATELLVDDGDAENAPYGQISNVAVTTTGDMYFSGNVYWGNDKLFVLNSGEATATEISLGDGQYNVSDLAIVDDTLFVSVHAQTDGDSAGFKTVSLNTQTVTGHIDMLYNPTQIVVHD